MSDPVCSREIALASGNAHKLLEWQELLPSWRVVGLDMGGAPPESGGTFLENALAKARYGATLQSARSWVLGEDSGLLVKALDGAPGIRSARYAGPQASDADNVALLLETLAAELDRRAHFRCEVGLISPTGQELHATGTMHGRISATEAGKSGFGYDPVFIPEGEDRSVAELGTGWKVAKSHRARAASSVIKLLLG
jgi:XTP/dITP diphosphohydrolase